MGFDVGRFTEYVLLEKIDFLISQQNIKKRIKNIDTTGTNNIKTGKFFGFVKKMEQKNAIKESKSPTR